MAFENQIRLDQALVRARLLADGETVQVAVAETPRLADPDVDDPKDGFAVDVAGAPVAISAGALDADNNYVLLTIPPTAGGKAVTVSYDAETGSIMGDDYELLSFTDRPVANFSELGAPVVQSITVADDGVTVTWVFSHPMTGTALLGFSMTADGNPVTVSSGAIAGDTMTGTADATIYDGQVLLGSYDADTGDMESDDGILLASFTDAAATNSSTRVPAPVPVSATILANGTTLEVVFDRTLSSGSATLGFSRTVGSISSGSYAGSTLTFTIPEAFIGEAAGSLSYDAGTGTLAGATDDVETFGPLAITNNSTQARVAPTLTGAAIAANGTSVTLTFSESITGTPSLGFSMTAAAGAVSLTGGAIAGNQITYTAGSTIYSGQAVLLSYNSATGDIAGAEADLASFTDTAVTNNSTQTQFAISTLGSGLSIAGMGAPRLAFLTGTRLALADASADILGDYTANTTTGAITQTFTPAGVTQNFSDIVGLASNAIGFHYYVSSGTLRYYTTSGSSWTNVGGASNSNSSAAVIKVSSTVLLAFGATAQGTHSWNGSTWSLLTSNVPGPGGGAQCYGCNLGTTDLVALFSPTTGGYNLEAWSRSGTTWTKVGNTLFVSTTGTLGKSRVTLLPGSTRIVAAFLSGGGGMSARAFDWDGVDDWTEYGSATPVGSVTNSEGAIVGLTASRFVFADPVAGKLQMYAVT